MKVGDLVKERKMMLRGGVPMIGIVTSVSNNALGIKGRTRVHVEYINGSSMSRLSNYLEVINENR